MVDMTRRERVKYDKVVIRIASERRLTELTWQEPPRFKSTAKDKKSVKTDNLPQIVR